MHRLGFKLFTTDIQNNPNFTAETIEFVREHELETYIELMVIPSTTEEILKKFQNFLSGIEVVIHAPHNSMGFDTGCQDCFADNVKILSYAQKAADMLCSRYIIVHAGCGRGQKHIEETARQFRLFNDSRIVVENLPYKAENVKAYMHGTTPEQIKYIMDETTCGFCFDFSHAICASNSLGLDINKQLAGFYSLKPSLYHLCDGNIRGSEDKHLHYGEGNFPLGLFLQEYVSLEALITMETGTKIPTDASAWIEDFNYLRKLEK